MNINSFLNNFNLSVDEIGAKERAAMLASRSIKTESKIWALKTAISMIDLTTLEGKDSEGKVHAMCQKAIHPKPGDDSSRRFHSYPDSGFIVIISDRFKHNKCHR